MRLLFVDDEAQVLESIERNMFDVPDEWVINYAESGHAALELVNRHPFDIVVTDMRMPGMNGAQLLEAVKAVRPSAVRIILTGQPEKGLDIKMLKSAHQILTKPCPVDKLKQVIMQLCSVIGLAPGGGFREIFTSIDTLPSLPSGYVSLHDELSKDEPDISRIADLISRDVSLSAVILKVANSPFFGINQKVRTPLRATLLLGTDIVKSLLAAGFIFSQGDTLSRSGFSINKLWEHSFYTGVCARAIARAEGLSEDDVDKCFNAGIMHDVGKAVMLANISAKYAHVIDECRKRNITVFESEVSILGMSHPFVGGFLLALWGFDEEVVKAVFCHHNPSLSGEEASFVVMATHVANRFEHELRVYNTKYSINEVDLEYVATRCGEFALNNWMEACRQEMCKVADIGKSA